MNNGLLAIYIVVGISLLVAANQHGKSQPKYNFWISLFAKAISLTLIWWAMGWRFI